MNRNRDLLERLHAANPVPSTEHVDPDELAAVFSVIEERRGVVTTTRTPVPQETKPSRRRSWRPAVAFTAALALVLATIGAAALIMRGDDEATDVGQTTSTQPEVPTTAGAVDEPTTVAPEPTSPPEPATTLVEPPAQPFVLTLSEQPELGTRMALDQDGLPVLVSLTIEPGAETGMVRLFRFSKDFEPEVVDLYERGWHSQPAELSVAPNGDVYLLRVDDLEDIDFAVVRNGELIDLPDVFEHDSVSDYVTSWPIAFDSAQNPLLMDFRLGFGDEIDELALVRCADALCTDNDRVFIDDGPFVWPEDELVVNGEQVLVTYRVDEPTGPADPEAGWDGAEFGSTWKRAGVDLTDLSVEIEVLADYQPRLEPVQAWPENVYDPDEYVGEGYTEGLEGANIQLAVCSDTQCTSSEVTTVATRGGWMYLQTLNVEEAADGTIYLSISNEERSAEWYGEQPGLTLHVFPDGEIGEGVEPIAGIVDEAGWPAL